MSNDAGRNRSGYLLGTIHGPDGQFTGQPKEVCVIEPETGAEICRVAVDQAGRFLLRCDAVSDSSSETVELRVLCDRGSIMERVEAVVPRSSAARLRITLDRPASLPSRSTVAPPLPTTGPALVAVEMLAQMGEALKGRVPEQDGRPLVPSWVNASIRELNMLAAVGQRVLEGDRSADRAFLRLVGEPGRGVVGEPRFFPQLQPHGRPCIVDATGAFMVTAAGFLLDRLRADRLGDLTHPGVLTRQAVDLIKDRAFALEAFRDEVLDGQMGRIDGASLHSPFGPGGQGPDEPLDWPGGGPIPGGRPGGRGGVPSPGPGTPGPGGRGGFPCGLWVDCVDEIVGAASRYQPPASCPREETIGSISPSAICLGATDVELEIRPVVGQSFSSSGVCNVFLQRAFNKKLILELISSTSDLIRVRLKEATFSGCLGFRGEGVGIQGNMAFIDSCFRITGMVRNPVLDLARAGFGITQIACTGRNGLDVVPPPTLISLHASGPNAGANGVSQVSLAEEGCAEVTLSWQFDLGSESAWVDPTTYIRVQVIASDGTVVGQNLPPTGSEGVTAREDESYLIRAVSVVNGSTCGQAEGSITVERYQQLHLSGPASLQVGQTANVTARSSCPALAGGITVSLSSSSSGRLQVPLTAVIPEGQDTISAPVAATGAGCLDVVLSASAPEHLGDSLSIDVFDTPTLESVIPSTVQTCQTFELQLTGACFKAQETVVRASKAGELPRTLDILNLNATSIRCRGSNFPPGTWSVSVTSRGLQSNALGLDVEAIPAEVVSFSAWLDQTLNPMFVPCQGNGVWVSWHVVNAVRVVIKENGTSIHDIELSGCGAVSQDNFSRIISRQAAYRLEAFPVGGGTPTIRTLTVGERGFQSLLLHNNSAHDLVVWKIEGWYSNSQDIPQDQNNKVDLTAGSEITLTFTDCVRYQVVAIDKQAASNANRDPYGNAIEVASLRRYDVTLVGETNGEQGFDIIS